MQKFWGRQDEIQKIKKKIKDFAESDTPLESNYIGYWGISGVGKSQLIERVLTSEDFMEMDFLPVVRIDCAAVGKDIIRLYDQIVESVEDVVQTTVFQTYKKCKDHNSEMIKDIFRGFSGAAIPDIVETAAVTVLGPVGYGMKVMKYLPKIASYVSSGGMEIINDMKHLQTMEEILSDALIKDFQSIAEQKMIIVLDSLECLENAHYELPQNFFDKDGLLSEISNVLWIVLGQTQNRYLQELKPLTMEEYIEDFRELINHGDDTEKRLAKVKNISQGIPYILQMIYEVFQDTLNDMILEESYWDETWNPVFNRFFMNYNNQTLKIIGILSALRNWDDRLVDNLLLYLRFHDLLKWNIEKEDFQVYQSLKVLPFVKQNGSYYSFQDCVIDFYRRILSDDEKNEIYELSTNYILQKYKHNNDGQGKVDEINLYLLTWLRELKENQDCDSLKREIIAALYFILNKFLSYENIHAWKNVVYEIISIAILSDRPELDPKIIKYLLFHANSTADTRKIQFCYWLQAKCGEKERNELYKEIKLLKSECVLARTKSSWKGRDLPFGIQFSIDERKKELCQSIFRRFQEMDNSCEKADYMIDCLAEYEYVNQENVSRTEDFLNALIQVMKAMDLVERTSLENLYRYINFFESLNLVIYHHKDILIKELEPFFTAFIGPGLKEIVPEPVRGEYYFQAGLYLFNRKRDSHEYFMQAKQYTIHNRYHKMWLERACANHFIMQEEISPKEFEIFVDSLEYIIEHADEITKWTLGVYLIVYTSILIAVGRNEGIPEMIAYITQCTPSVGCTVRDLDRFYLNNYYFNIVDYIINKMNDYTLALLWVNRVLSSAKFGSKDRKYFLCKIALLRYKIHVQRQLNDETLNDTVNELKALLYTAEAVLGKNAPEILSTRQWLKV